MTPVHLFPVLETNVIRAYFKLKMSGITIGHVGEVAVVLAKDFKTVEKPFAYFHSLLFRLSIRLTAAIFAETNSLS